LPSQAYCAKISLKRKAPDLTSGAENIIVNRRKKSKRKTGRHASITPADPIEAAWLERLLRQFAHLPGAEVDEKTQKHVEQKLEKNDLSRRNLDIWERAGMDRKRLRKLLAVIVAGDPKWVLGEMRDRQDALKRLAKRMEATAHDAQKVLGDHFSKIEMWAYVHGGGFGIGMSRPALWDEAFVRLSPEMEALAKALACEHRKFGKYLRKLGRTNPGIIELLLNCWLSCVPTMQKEKPIRFQLDHLKQLADLLMDAFEFAGKPSPVTADSLRKVFRRFVIPQIGNWLHSLPQRGR
jgi:hypothetical protein